MDSDEASRLFAAYRQGMAAMLPDAEIHLTGSASIPGLAADDVDLVVLVHDVRSAAATLRGSYPPLYEEQWGDDWAAFRITGRPSVGVVLTRRGTKWDAHHRRAWTLLREDESLLLEYKALKAAPARYEERKAEFFERLVRLLPPEPEEVAMTEPAIEIREFRGADLGAVIEFSLRAWAPVFASLRAVLGDDIFLRLHPDWEAGQAETVRSSCTNEERDVFVAVAEGRPVGFVAIALNAFHERMGVIDIIGVDPAYQRRGIGSRLTDFAIEHMRGRGMDIAVVETGGDAGHAPARAAYESAGFTLLPIARYFRLLP